MANLGDFSSLLQLGAGIGIGLAVFRAPFELRSTRLERDIGLERMVLSSIGSESAKVRLSELSSIQLLFIEKREQLADRQKPFMVATVACAAVNLVCLLAAALWSTHTLSTFEILSLIFISVVFYLCIALLLEVTARLYFAEVFARFETWMQGST